MLFRQSADGAKATNVAIIIVVANKQKKLELMAFELN